MGEEIELEEREKKESEIHEGEKGSEDDPIERQIKAREPLVETTPEEQEILDKLNTPSSDDEEIETRASEDNLDGLFRLVASEKVAIRGIEALEKIAKTLEDATADLGKKPRGIRRFCRVKYFAVVFGVLLGVASLTVSILELALNRKNSEDGEPDDFDEARSAIDDRAVGYSVDEDKAFLYKLIVSWRKQSDLAFWETIATHTSTDTPSIEAQILYMNYTRDLCVRSDVPANSGPIIEFLLSELREAYLRSGSSFQSRKTSQMYKHALALEGLMAQRFPAEKRIPVTRFLTAGLCAMVLSEIRAQEKSKY